MSTQSRRPRRGPRVLLWAIGTFIAVQLAASVLLDYAFPQIRFPKFYEQVARVEAFPSPPNIVFLGSSRTEVVLQEVESTLVIRELTGDPQVQCCNAYVPAGDLIVAERLLLQLLRHGVRPRYAVIEVCPEGLNHRNGWLTMYAGWVLRWGDMPAYLGDLAVTGNLPRYAGTRMVPLFVYRDQIRTQLGALTCNWLDRTPAEAEVTSCPNQDLTVASTETSAKWRRLIAAGVTPVSTDCSRTTIVGLDTVVRSLRSYRPGGNAAAALDRLLSLCRTHGIEPILLTVPLSSAHRQCYTSDIDRAFQEHIAAVTQEFSCRYVDCRAALPDNCFVDHHHATPDGGRLFSRKFALEVLAPMWHEGERRGVSPP